MDRWPRHLQAILTTKDAALQYSKENAGLRLRPGSSIFYCGTWGQLCQMGRGQGQGSTVIGSSVQIGTQAPLLQLETRRACVFAFLCLCFLTCKMGIERELASRSQANQTPSLPEAHVRTAAPRSDAALRGYLLTWTFAAGSHRPGEPDEAACFESNEKNCLPERYAAL